MAIAAIVAIAVSARRGPRQMQRRRRQRPRSAHHACTAGLTHERGAKGHVTGANRLTLDATLAERGDLRYTPAGIPALECVLRHASVQPEAGGERRVECELAAVAFGEPALALSRIPAGTELRCKGFLARRYRTGVTLALHLNEFESKEGNDHAPSPG